MSFPIWHTYRRDEAHHSVFRDKVGCKPGTTGSGPIKPGVYRVKGDPIRTGSHSICAAYEIFNGNNERYSWDVIKPDFMWILNYGAPGPSQKGMWWVLHKQKQLFGQQDSGHTAFVINPAIHLMGYTGSKTPPEFQHYPDKEYTVGHQFRKDPTYRRQLVCSVYDSFNNYLSIYVNGVLFGEKHLSMYDHNAGLSNHWGKE